MFAHRSDPARQRGLSYTEILKADFHLMDSNGELGSEAAVGVNASIFFQLWKKQNLLHNNLVKVGARSIKVHEKKTSLSAIPL